MGIVTEAVLINYCPYHTLDKSKGSPGRLSELNQHIINQESKKTHPEVRQSKDTENPLLCESNVNNGKIVKINYFRTLESNQKLVAIQGVFVQENQPNLSKKHSLIASYLLYSHFPLLSSAVALKINSQLAW